jgi:hypothetical protein
MYVEGGRQYKYHLEHYGHPTKFGYLDARTSFPRGRAKQAVPLGSASPHARGQIEQVELLGFPEKLKWTREETGLRIEWPEHAVAFRVSGVGFV